MPKRVAAAGLLLSVIGFLSSGCGGGSEAPKYPDAFDPRMIDLVDFVEAERGLAFLHPVFVDFLDEEAFVARVTERDELSEEELTELEDALGLMRALGVVQGELDLLELSDQVASGTVLAFYEFEGERIVVRGNDEFTARTRATLVHELTHALQDQHYGIRLEDASDGEETAWSALIEADAERIEEAFVDDFSSAERVEYSRDEEDFSSASEAELEEVPPIFVELFVATHALGPAMLDAIIAMNGEDAIDAAFRAPPTSDEHVISPERYIEGDLTIEVDPPTLREGEEELERGEFGMLALLMVLGERLGFADAWRAADGWGGDEIVSFRRDGIVCVRLAVAGDTPKDVNELIIAFDRWAETMPDAESERDGDLALLSSCDPGEEFDLPASPDQERTFYVLVLRAAVISVVGGTGLDYPRSACRVDVVIATLGSDDFARLVGTTVNTPADSQRLRAAAARGAALCGTDSS